MSLQNNINRLETISQQNAELTYQNSTLLEMVASDYAESQLAKQKLVDAINLAGGAATMDNSLSEIADMFKDLMSNGVPMSGADGLMEFEGNGKIDSAMSIIREWTTMTKFVDKYSTTVPRYLINQVGKDMYITAEHVEYTKASRAEYACFNPYIYMKYLRLPKLTTDTSGGFANSRYCWNKIIEIYMPMMPSFPGFPSYTKTDGGLKDLIDITMGGGATSGTFKLGDVPFENAITLSASLLTEQDILDGFTSNKEKWLWNLRNHFAALLGETSNGQIIFSANAYAALDEETITAFTSKGWTVASA